MINKLIEQIGGREKLQSLVHLDGMGCVIYRSGEVAAMARALLAVLDAQEKPSAWIINCNSARINFAETEKTSVDKIIEECRENGTDIDITPLYTTPPAASVPDGWLLIPAIPSQSHLNSIAMRYRHDFYLLPDTQRESVLSTARQMYEECSGQGFYSISKPAAPAPGGE